MPYKSRQQQRAMHAKASKGQISKKTVDEFDSATDFSKLPDKAAPKGEGPKGSHDDSHKKLGGARGHFREGSPKEQNSYKGNK